MNIYTGKRARLLKVGINPHVPDMVAIDAGSTVIVERAANRVPGQWVVRDEETYARALVSETDLAPVEAQS